MNIDKLKDPHFWPVVDLTPRPKIPPEEIVLNIVKGGMESKFGIEFDKFMETYQEILKNNPEKLI